MNEWVFTITDYDAAGTPTVTVIDNPKNWGKAKIKMKRSPEMHGVMTEYSFNNFEFAGEAASILENAYETLGIEANTTIEIVWDCDNRQLLYNGKFNYLSYNKIEDFKNGKGCYVECQIEQIGSTMTFLNRMDQKVDLDSLETFDGSVMAPYDRLGFDLTLEPKGILLTDKVTREANETYDFETDSAWANFFDPTRIGPATVMGWMNVFFDTTDLEETAELTQDSNGIFVANANFSGGGPQNNYIFENLNPAIGTYNIDTRLKGVVTINTIFTNEELNNDLFLAITTVAGGVDPNVGPSTNLFVGTIQAAGILPGGTMNFPFDFSFSGSFSLNPSQKIYLWMSWDITANSNGNINDNIRVRYDSGTYFNINGIEREDATTTKAYMINEVLSRQTEAITDNEMRAYSEYFGRTDSEPLTAPADGCGSLEILTSGLQVRNALPSGLPPIFALSLKEVFDGLKAIHCIGMGIEEDILDPTKKMVRIEPFDYFYQSGVVLYLDNVNKIDRPVKPDGYISVFKFGYAEVFPAEQFNGIDDFLTNREYRTTLKNANKTLEALSSFIASGYAIEVTRQQTGTTADYRYDNKTFIICVERDGLDFIVEQGNITNEANIIDPPTIYNYRISPWRNALRWFKILFTAYVTASLNDRLIFSSGTGNYFAEGTLTGGCVVERTFAANSEMGNVNYFSFQSYTGNMPLWKNESAIFDYPLTVSQWNLLQANPYDKIGFNFADGDWFYGWIDEVEYTPATGMAHYILIPERTE